MIIPAMDATPGQTAHLLVVEDDQDIRETLQQALELEGYQVSTAGNGKEALDILHLADPPSRPHLILLDLMMPIMDGWEFLEKARSTNLLSGIPVVIVSAAGERARSVNAD